MCALLAFVLGLSSAAPIAAADTTPPDLTSGPTRTMVAGARYQASRGHRFLFGTGYRRLWATPIEVEVLDLGGFSGGLVAKKKGGGKQTRTLRFDGADGREWRFRSLDKDPAGVLPEGLRKGLVKDFVQDQTSAALPAACLVVDALSAAAGILHAKCRLVVLPDDVRLGEFREEFAGMPGTLEEKASTKPPVTPGFEEFEKIADTDEMEKSVDANPGERVDADRFLRARLLDALIGDYDRHGEQWDWAREVPSGRWVAYPHDRDQALVRFDGLFIGISRFAVPQLVSFEDDYPRPLALAYTARFLDRRFLSELEWSEWQEATSDLQARLGDGAIDEAVRAMPPPYYRLVGPELVARLKRRRDRLPAFARRFYEMLARQPEVHATDDVDSAQLFHRADGSVEVILAASSGPYFRRAFRPAETSEVRIFLKEGDDRVISEGSGRPRVAVRVVGGEGNDLLDDSAGGYTRFYDSSGENRVVEGVGTGTNDRPYAPHLDRLEEPERDWGTSVGAAPMLRVNGDQGLLLGGAFEWDALGFRRHPFARRHSLRFDYSTSLGKGAFEYRYETLREGDQGRFDVVAGASALELVHYHGLGNETGDAGPKSFYDVEQTQYVLSPAYRLDTHALDVWVGPLFKYVDTDPAAAGLLAQERPYGTGGFGQAGARIKIALDRGYREAKGLKGASLSAEGAFYPSLWNVRDTFGEIHGQVRAFVTARVPLKPTLALRAGGRKVFGSYPLHEAAFIGGGDTVRGLESQRYAGDASAYGNAELRLLLRQRDGTLVSRLGVFGLTDVGRVFVKDESSDRWHAAVGGGLWLSVVDPAYTASLAVARSDGHVRVYVQAGLMF